MQKPVRLHQTRLHWGAMKYKPLTERQGSVIDRHFAQHPPSTELTRVEQWDGASSVYNPRTRRLHVHKHDKKKSAMQELVFESSGSVCSTIVGCNAHLVKLWDMRRQLTDRELARVQGFPEWFKTPDTYVHNLFGNAVAVPVAEFACQMVRGREPPSPLRFIDVCSGIGGFHCAAASAFPGAVCAGFSEIKPAAVACYTKNFPSAPALGAAETAIWPAADLVCAGFPCQPFSRSQHGFAVSNHPLFQFFEHVCRCVEDSGASRIVFENVASLRTTGVQVLHQLLERMQAMGFQVEHGILDAKDFGVPQTRRRLFIVGMRDEHPQRLHAHTPTAHAVLRSVLEQH